MSNSTAAKTDARELISEIVRRDLPTLSLDTPLENVDGWDSMRGVRLVLRLEGVLGRELEESEIERLRTIGDIESILGSGA